MLYWDGDVQAGQRPHDQSKPSDLEVGESV
jgi:hypothetical protein